MFTGRDYLVEAERRKNEAAEVAHFALLRQVSGQDGRVQGQARRWLARLAALVMGWNSQLRTDYTVKGRPSPTLG